MPTRAQKPQIQWLDLSDAGTQLARVDKQMATLIKKVGPCQIPIAHMQSPFEALAESIIYQQLHGKAAATIFGRVKEHFGSDRLLCPEAIMQADQSVLRGAGVSTAKTAAIKDLARVACAGELPTLEELKGMSDEDIAECLVSIRGIGRWTVDMLLIFRLGRTDVLPSTDYGIRKGFAQTYGLEELPTPKAVVLHAEKWKPYRTVGSWYLWRATEL